MRRRQTRECCVTTAWNSARLTTNTRTGQLSLAIPPSVGAMSTSQTAVMLCGWEVKAGMVRVWVAGKTV